MAPIFARMFSLGVGRQPKEKSNQFIHHEREVRT
jgi:hypothetical protein